MSFNRRNLNSSLLSLLCGVTLPQISKAQLGTAGAESVLNLIVPFPAGAGSDSVGRILAKTLSNVGENEVMVSNITGANGVIAANALVNSYKPNSTVMYGSTSIFAYIPTLAPDTLKFSVEHELLPIATVGIQRYLLVASTNLDSKKLLNHRDQNQSWVPPPMGAVGSASVLSFHSHVLAHTIGKDLNIIPFRGMADLTQSMLAGHIQLGIVEELAARKLIDSGKFQPLATMASEPSLFFPTVPLWRDLGFEALEMDLLFVLYAGRRMSMARRIQLIERLRILKNIPAFNEVLRSLGMLPTVLVGEDAHNKVQESVNADRRYINKYKNIISNI